MLDRYNVTLLSSDLVAAVCDTTDKVLISSMKPDSLGDASNVGMIVGISAAVFVCVALAGFLTERPTNTNRLILVIAKILGFHPRSV